MFPDLILSLEWGPCSLCFSQFFLLLLKRVAGGGGYALLFVKSDLECSLLCE